VQEALGSNPSAPTGLKKDRFRAVFFVLDAFMISSSAPTNRLSLISFLSACLTVSSFCIGFAPIPLTAWVCYPAAVLFGMISLVSGFTSLRQVRASGEKGRAMSLIGIWTGILTILAVICTTTITVLALYYGLDYFQTYWPQFKP
jgi:uncharacterized membrane protein